jgi:hypothetical protein
MRLVVGEIGFGAAEFADGVARVGSRGDGLRCSAHTPQGTPRVRARTRQASGRESVGERDGLRSAST